jgi:hypothetical protein
MNIDDLTIGEAKELARMFAPTSNCVVAGVGCNSMIGKKCIFRSYASGVHYGELVLMLDMMRQEECIEESAQNRKKLFGMNLKRAEI